MPKNWITWEVGYEMTSLASTGQAESSETASLVDTGQSEKVGVGGRAGTSKTTIVQCWVMKQSVHGYEIVPSLYFSNYVRGAEYSALVSVIVAGTLHPLVFHKYIHRQGCCCQLKHLVRLYVGLRYY